jgi:hypothetical protein
VPDILHPGWIVSCYQAKIWAQEMLEPLIIKLCFPLKFYVGGLG